MLSPGASGSICDKCKEKVKKKQAKVKQRYKLEPKKVSVKAGQVGGIQDDSVNFPASGPPAAGPT